MKKFFKLLGLIVIVALIGFSMAACEPEKDEANATGNGGGNDGGSSGGSDGIKPTITIKNNTGYTIMDIYFKPSTATKSWGEDYMSYSFLDDGKSGGFTLDKTLSECKEYDILLYGSNYNFIKYKVTVSNKMTITFTTSDLNNMSSLPNITIQNRTGKRFGSIYIKPSASSDWGENFLSRWLGTDVLDNNYDKSDITLLVPPTNYTKFDIKAESSNPTSTYTKSNVTISNGMTILFTNTDRVNSTIEPPVIVIQNNTDYNIADAYIKLSSSSDWGSDLINNVYIVVGDYYAISVPSSISNGSRIDIRIIKPYFIGYSTEYYFKKTSVTLVDGMVLTFTTADLETVTP